MRRFSKFAVYGLALLLVSCGTDVDRKLDDGGGGGADTSRVATPVLVPSSAISNSPITVSISTTTPNALIYYTVDGLDPTESSNFYAGPLTITRTSTVRARAYLEPMLPSELAIGTYTIADGDDFESIIIDVEWIDVDDKVKLLVEGGALKLKHISGDPSHETPKVRIERPDGSLEESDWSLSQDFGLGLTNLILEEESYIPPSSVQKSGRGDVYAEGRNGVVIHDDEDGWRRYYVSFEYTYLVSTP